MPEALKRSEEELEAANARLMESERTLYLAKRRGGNGYALEAA